MGPLGPLLGPPEQLLGLILASWGALFVAFGVSVFERPWPSWLSWGPFGALGCSWAPLGALLAALGAVLGPLGLLLGPPEQLLGLILASRGALFGAFGIPVFERPWKKRKP